MPEQIQKSWERLEKRVIKFNENFPEAHVICFAVVDNFYRSAGNQQMKVHFVETDVIKNKYREIIAGQSVINQNEPREEEAAEEAELHDSLKDSLTQHCFDMDMNQIRAIITTVLSPDKPLGTGRMRGFYKEENCPSWWRETSVPFASLNNPKAGQKRATIEDGYKLIESLQEFCQVYPPRPIKLPNSTIQFRSRFYCEAQSSSSDCPVPVNVTATLTSVFASSTTPTTSTVTSSTHTTDASTSAMPAHASSNTATSTPDTSNSPTPTHATYYTATPIPATSTTSMPTSAMPGPATCNSATASSNTSTSATSYTATTIPATSTASVPTSAMSGPATCNSATASSNTFTSSTSYTHSIPATSTASVPTSAMPGPATCNSATASSNTSTSATSFTATPIPATSTASVPTSAMPGPATCNSATASSNTSTSATSNPTVTFTSATPTPATSNTAYSLRQRREQLISLSKEPMNRESCIALLRILGAGNWNELVALSEELKAFIPAFPTSLAKEWEMPTLLSTNKRFKDFIPASIGNRTVISASSDGNCIFNAFSIALYGNEDEAFFLRLASVVTVADNILQYSKYMVEEFGKDVTHLISSLSGTEYTVPENLSDGERIEYFCMQELLLTARMPFRDCTLFHMHILSNLLQRPVVSHYSKKNARVPFMQHLFPSLIKTLNTSAIHVVWMPVKPSLYANLRHVVPAVCLPGPFGSHFDECALEGMSCCAFMMNANPDHHSDSVMVECTLCGQWVHDVCARINAQKIEEDDPFLCGCDRIKNGKFVIKRI